MPITAARYELQAHSGRLALAAKIRVRGAASSTRCLAGVVLGVFILGISGCTQVSEGPLPPLPFVVAKLPSCPAPVRAASAGRTPLVVRWQELNGNTLPKGVQVRTDAPVVFRQTRGNEPMSLVTKPPGSICALTPLETESGSPAHDTDRRTVAFVRSGHVEVDLQKEEEGMGAEEPLFLNVLATKPG
jgi:hypothetical protein